MLLWVPSLEQVLRFAQDDNLERRKVCSVLKDNACYQGVIVCGMRFGA